MRTDWVRQIGINEEKYKKKSSLKVWIDTNT